MDIVTGITYAIFVLSVLGNILQFVAPRTKTTLDDKAEVLVDEAQRALDKLK